MATPKDQTSIAVWLLENIPDIYIWMVTIIGIPSIMSVDWYQKFKPRWRIFVMSGIMLLGIVAGICSFRAKGISEQKAQQDKLKFDAKLVALEERRLWMDKGGDSSPHILPSFDPDRTRLFIYNDSEYPSYLLYGELSGTMYFVDGGSLPFKNIYNNPLEISRKDRRWILDPPLPPNVNRISLSFSSKARNGEFANQIEIVRRKGRLACVWIAGQKTPKSKEVCP